MELLTNVKHHETTCRTHKKTQLWLRYFWSYGSLNIVDIENSHLYYVLVSALEVKNCYRYFDKTSHKCKASGDKKGNSGNPTIEVMAL